MKRKTFTYILSVVLFCCTSFLGCTDAHAQRAKRHREGSLTADSIRIMNQRDSLALADTLYFQQQQELKALEAPVDTAVLARQNDSIQATMGPVKETKRWIPNSNKTVWLSLVIPGAGQIYNRKYWKLPIIYGGFVGCAYALTWNGQMYNDVNDRLEHYQDLFRRRKDMYRRQRDLSVIAFIAVYLLSVIDAYVDAELSDFDISKDLTMTWEPTVFNDAFRHRPQGVGLQCNIKF